MHLPSRPAIAALSALLASLAVAQSSTSTSTSTTTTTTAPAHAAAAPGTVTAPTATTTAPPVTAPNAVAQPVNRPVTPPVGNPPQTPSTAVNPLAPNLPSATQPVLPNAASVTAQSVVNGATATEVADPNNINALAAAGLDVALNPTAALATLRQAPVANQQTVLRALQSRLDATTRALIDLRAQARANGVAGAGANFDQAAEDIRLREVALRDALSSAGGTADEAAWRQAQTQIATLYQAYADSVQRARALLQPTPQP